MNPTPLDSLYMWMGLSLVTLEYDGQVDYVKTHSLLTLAWCGFGRTNPYTHSLLDAQTLASKELVYRLVHPNPLCGPLANGFYQHGPFLAPI